MTLADAAPALSVPWAAATIVVSVSVFVLSALNTHVQRKDEKAAREKKDADDLVREQQVRAEAHARSQDEKALAAHHKHDDERFDAFDRRLTALAEARRDGDHDLNGKIGLALTEIARLDERIVALKRPK